jgi:hypothetical protein
LSARTAFELEAKLDAAQRATGMAILQEIRQQWQVKAMALLGCAN